jgi:hypothetical protein
MLHTLAPVPVERRSSHTLRRAFVAAGVASAAVLAVLIVVAVNTAASTVIAPRGPFAPTAEDGLISEGTVVTLADSGVPAIQRLDPGLRDAFLRAEADAASDGIAFQVTSGWRDVDYQRWLFDDAVERYASEDIARQFVATPERSSHVTGDAVDIGPLDAQFWLIEHGWRYGICQTYANERWHFELATEPGGVCPDMKADAAS